MKAKRYSIRLSDTHGRLFHLLDRGGRTTTLVNVWCGYRDGGGAGCHRLVGSVLGSEEGLIWIRYVRRPKIQRAPRLGYVLRGQPILVKDLPSSSGDLITQCPLHGIQEVNRSEFDQILQHPPLGTARNLSAYPV